LPCKWWTLAHTRCRSNKKEPPNLCPPAASRRLGLSRNWTPALSCATAMGSNSPMSISRMNRRDSCAVTRHAAALLYITAMKSIPNWHFTLSRYRALLADAHSGHEATRTLEKTNDCTEKAFYCHSASRRWNFACDGAERSPNWWLSAGNGRRGRQSCRARTSLLSRRKIRWFRNFVSSGDQAPQKDLHVSKVTAVDAQ
jgi:hypothetical protein